MSVTRTLCCLWAAMTALACSVQDASDDALEPPAPFEWTVTDVDSSGWLVPESFSVVTVGGEAILLVPPSLRAQAEPRCVVISPDSDVDCSTPLDDSSRRLSPSGSAPSGSLLDLPNRSLVLEGPVLARSIEPAEAVATHPTTVGDLEVVRFEMTTGDGLLVAAGSVCFDPSCDLDIDEQCRQQGDRIECALEGVEALTILSGAIRVDEWPAVLEAVAAARSELGSA